MLSAISACVCMASLPAYRPPAPGAQLLAEIAAVGHAVPAPAPRQLHVERVRSGTPGGFVNQVA